jgi:hypothetical protein
MKCGKYARQSSQMGFEPGKQNENIISLAYECELNPGFFLMTQVSPEIPTRQQLLQ